MSAGASGKPTIIVEHLDPELEEWQALEYKCIYEECETSTPPWNFLLSGLSSAAGVGKQLSLPSSSVTEQSVEALYQGDRRRNVCLLDPKAEKDLSPEDGEKFDVFLFGGILGDDPPRDRTGELRKMGFEGRRLGQEQMTTDTAARVTRIVVADRQPLGNIPYVDRPDIKLPASTSGHEGAQSGESVSMPFRYVKGKDGKGVMPKGMLDLLASDADKDIMDLL
ncbi:hypothetical protein LTR09_003770 [Extremus antarcticus]|uniref:DUF431-domain-containing protein n=1 Tax=Extremus antarcticus TaxID=702011 RepID=A0AAJ0DRI1_9PEZI|nr:hypothetical protein LTR09_003770 [Extremus antarcticus]